MLSGWERSDVADLWPYLVSSLDETVVAFREYIDARKRITRYLEGDDVKDAISQCWKFTKKGVRLKSGLLRSKMIYVMEPERDQSGIQRLERLFKEIEKSGVRDFAEKVLYLHICIQRLLFASYILMGPDDSREDLMGIDIVVREREHNFQFLEKLLQLWDYLHVDLGVRSIAPELDDLASLVEGVQEKASEYCLKWDALQTIPLICTSASSSCRGFGNVGSMINDPLHLIQILIDQGRAWGRRYAGMPILRLFSCYGLEEKLLALDSHGKHLASEALSRLVEFIQIESSSADRLLIYIQMLIKDFLVPSAFPDCASELLHSFVCIVTGKNREEVTTGLGNKDLLNVDVVVFMSWILSEARGRKGLSPESPLIRHFPLTWTPDGLRLDDPVSVRFLVKWIMMYIILLEQSCSGLENDSLGSYASPLLKKGIWDVSVASCSGPSGRKDAGEIAEFEDGRFNQCAALAWKCLQINMGIAADISAVIDSQINNESEIWDKSMLTEKALAILQYNLSDDLLGFVARVCSIAPENPRFLVLLSRLNALFSSIIQSPSVITDNFLNEISILMKKVVTCIEHEDISDLLMLKNRFSALMCYLSLFILSFDVWRSQGDRFNCLSRALGKLIHLLFGLAMMIGCKLPDKTSEFLDLVFRYLTNVFRIQPSHESQIVFGYLLESIEINNWFAILATWWIFAYTAMKAGCRTISDAIMLQDQDSSASWDLESTAEWLILLQGKIGSLDTLEVKLICIELLSRWIRIGIIGAILDRDNLLYHLQSSASSKEVWGPYQSRLEEIFLANLDSVDHLLDVQLQEQDQAFLLLPRELISLQPFQWLCEVALVVDASKQHPTNSDFIGTHMDFQLDPNGSENASRLDILESQLMKQISISCQDLNRWSKRIEKGTSEIYSSKIWLKESREEDIPQPVGCAQSHLWELNRWLDKEVSSSLLKLQHSTDNLYLDVDEGYLQETSEIYSEGECIPAPGSQNINEVITPLQESLQSMINGLKESKDVRKASEELFKIEIFVTLAILFQRDAKIFTAAKLLTIIIESLLFGITPSLGASYLSNLIEYIWSFRCVTLEAGMRTQTASYIAKSLQGTGIENPLDQEIGIKMLNILLEPGTMLDRMELRDFFDLLDYISHLCLGGLASKASILLSSFDTNRFGVLLAQKIMESPKMYDGMASSSGGSASDPKRQKDFVDISQVMTFVQNMVLDDRTCDAGSNILDGLITMSQESFLCPTLQVLCYSGHFRGKSNLMSKVNDIIGSVESLDLVCECYDILSGLTAGSSLEYVQVIAALMKSVPFGQYITKVNPSNKENKILWTFKPVESPEILIRIVKIGQGNMLLLHELFNKVLRKLLVGVDPANQDRDIVSYRLEAIFSTLPFKEVVDSFPSGAFQWLWELYLDVFRISLAAIDKLHPSLGSEVFNRFWSQIPWPLSSFHLQSVESIRSIRRCMSDPSDAGLQLTSSLNWSLDVMSCKMNADSCKSCPHDARISLAMKSEIVAMILHLSIMRSASDLPDWMKIDNNLNENILLNLMQDMDWNIFQDICGESLIPGPWIIQPIVLGSANGNSQELVSRVKRIAKLLCICSQRSSVESTGIALEAILPLFGFSLCSGRLSLNDREGFTGGKVELPESIPVELLQGTVELEQLKIQNSDAREIQSGSCRRLKSMLVQSCFKLTLYDHIEIFDMVLDTCSKYSDLDLLKPLKSYVHGMNARQVQSYDPWAYFSLPGAAMGTFEPRSVTQDTSVIEKVLRAMADESSTLFLSIDLNFGSDALPWFIGDFEVSSSHLSRSQQSRKFSPARALHFASIHQERTASASSSELIDSERHSTDLEALYFILSSKFEQYAINRDNLHLSNIGISSCNVLFGKDLFDNEVIVFLFERLIRKLSTAARMTKREDGEELELGVPRVPVSPIAGDSSSIDDKSKSRPMLQEEFRRAIPKSINALSLLKVAIRSSLDNHPLFITVIVQEAQKRALISEKYEWQKYVILVLKAMQRPYKSSMEAKDVINLWLHSLEWLNDSRWRRLLAGDHISALKEFLIFLDKQVESLDELAPSSMPDQKTGVYSRVAAASQSTASTIRHKMSAALKHINSRESNIELDPIPQRSDVEIQDDQSILSNQSGLEIRTPPKQRISSGFRNFGKKISSMSNRIASLAKNEEARPSQDFDSSDTQETRMLSAADDSVHETGSHPVQSDLARISLAAFAIAAYIRSVMDPHLTRRTISAEAGALAHYRTPQHSRVTSNSGQMEDQQIQELDTVLEARKELDTLNRLRESRVLISMTRTYQCFFDQIPSLLQYGTSVSQFQQALMDLLE